MPKSKRPRRERTHDWRQIQHYTLRPGGIYWWQATERKLCRQKPRHRQGVAGGGPQQAVAVGASKSWVDHLIGFSITHCTEGGLRFLPSLKSGYPRRHVVEERNR